MFKGTIVGAYSKLKATESLSATTPVVVTTKDTFVTGIVISEYEVSGSASSGTVTIRNGNDERIATVPVDANGNGQFMLSAPLYAKGGVKILSVTDSTGEVDIFAI